MHVTANSASGGRRWSSRSEKLAQPWGLFTGRRRQVRAHMVAEQHLAVDVERLDDSQVCADREQRAPSQRCGTQHAGICHHAY